MINAERLPLFYFSLSCLHCSFHHLWHENVVSCLEKSQSQEYRSATNFEKETNFLLHPVLYLVYHLDLGLFIYLTLTYFFSNDEWMIIVRNLILLPQIVHNVRLGSNPGFNFYYIFGFIGSRLLITMYERLCPENRFRLSPNIELVVILLSIFVLEVNVLLKRWFYFICNLA